MKELCGKEDGGQPIMDGAASDRAELSGLQEGGQEWEKAGHKHLGEKLVISVEEGDWPQLRGHGHPRDQHGIEAFQQRGSYLAKGSHVKINGEAIEPRGLWRMQRPQLPDATSPGESLFQGPLNALG